MWNDLRYTLRGLRRTPLFTAAAVISLALGIGANTAIFSLLDQVLLRTLPVRDPDRLVILHTEYQAPGWSQSDNHLRVFSYPMYSRIRDRSTVFSGVIARSFTFANITAAGEAERGFAEIVSGNLFDVLGVKPAAGRLFTAGDDRTPGGHPVVVLSYGYWQRRFGGRADAVGRRLLINGHPMVVAGVAPASFRGVVSGQTPDIFVPIAMQKQVMPVWDALEDIEARWLNIIGRLRPGVTREKAEAATRLVYRGILQEELAHMGKMRSPRAEQEFLNHKLELLPAGQGINQLRRSWQDPLVALMAMVGAVLLIGCANIANLLLARAAARQRELAIRTALGAGRAAIIRQVLVESVLIALLGGLAGLAVASWTGDILLGTLPQDAAGGWLATRLDLRVLAFALALSVVTGLLFGLAPALQSSRQALAPALSGRGMGTGGRRSEGRLRRALVVGQVALSLLLLIGAGLFARSLVKLAAVDPGFRAEKLLVFGVDPQLSGYNKERTAAFFTELRRRLAAIPGVRYAGGSNPAPLSHSDRGANLTVEGYRASADEDLGGAISSVTPEYFKTLGIPLVAGREFTDADGANAPKVVVVNQTFVRQYFGGSNPLGKHIAFGRGNKIVPDREIVGVARDNHHDDLRKPPRPTVFLPYPQDPISSGRMNFFVRSERNAGELAGDVRRLMRALDAGIPVQDIRPMQVLVDESLYTERLIAMLSAAFGALATLLAAVGLYGVIAYTVERRTSEIGVRLALGGVPRNVLWFVMREVVVLVGLGIAIGLPAALAAGRLIESQLFGLKGGDPLVISAAVLSLAAVALLSGYVPARRAAKLDPINALRYE